MSMQHPKLARLLLIGTGGTIAGQATAPTDTTGYTAGALPAEALLERLPGLDSFAEVRCENLFELDSKDIGPAHWLQIARHCARRLADPAVDGIVLTHGSDTLEETAYFLDLTLPRSKPVVLCCAMRPASALSADGPMNLWQALQTAARRDLTGVGPVVVVNDRIHAARLVCKRHPRALDAIASEAPGPLGLVGAPLDWRPSHSRPPLDAQRLPALPRVDLLTVAAGADPDLIAACVSLGAAGLVLALPGHASLPERWAHALHDCPLPVVFASRTGAGPLEPRHLPLRRHLCGHLPPLKARIRLMLGLAQGFCADTLDAWLADR